MRDFSFLGVDISRKELEDLVKKLLVIEPLKEIIRVVSLGVLGELSDKAPVDVSVSVGQLYVHGRCFCNENPTIIFSPQNTFILAHEIGHAFGLGHVEYDECSYCNGRVPACGDIWGIMCYNASIPHHNPGLLAKFSDEDINKLRDLK